MPCNCESLACTHAWEDQLCPNKTDESSPTMVFVGKVCKWCAKRITDNGGASLLNGGK